MLLARRLSTQRAFVVRDEVRAAVAARRPVVALESTIITHGMPFPRNLEVARACEAAPRCEDLKLLTVVLDWAIGGRALQAMRLAMPCMRTRDACS